VALTDVLAFPMASSTPTPSSLDASTKTLDYLSSSFQFIFSFLVVPALAVIVSGILLATRLNLSTRFRLNRGATDVFGIPIPGLFSFQAVGDEVTWGFAVYFLNFAIISGFAGHAAYLFFLSHFGIDIGPWDSLCILSSLSSVVISVLIFIFGALRLPVRSQSVDRDKQIDRIANP
jgi:hypothetical protein